MSTPEFLDKRINKVLNEKDEKETNQYPFIIDGRQNGILINPNQSFQNTKLLYINCIYANDKLNYELVVIHFSLDTKQLINKIPLNLQTLLELQTKHNTITPLKQLTIKLTQNPLNPMYFKLEISEIVIKSQRSDKLYLFIYDHKQKENLKPIFCKRMNLSAPIYAKAEFHPFCQSTLVVLLEKDHELNIIQYQNFNQVTQKIEIRFKDVRSSERITQGDYFCNIYFPDKCYNLIDKFTMYIQTKKGIIYTLFPLIVGNMTLTKQQKEQLKERKNQHKNYNSLYNVIRLTCDLLQDSNRKDFFNLILRRSYFHKLLTEIQLIHLPCIQKPLQAQFCFDSMFIYTVREVKIVFQTAWVKNTPSILKISLLPKNICSQEYQLYPLATYSNKDQSETHLKIVSCSEHVLYLSDESYLYYLKFQSLIEACKSKNFRNISLPKLECLFKVQYAQKTISLVSSLEGIHLIRQKQGKVVVYNYFPTSCVQQMVTINQIYQRFGKIGPKIQSQKRNINESKSNNEGFIRIVEGDDNESKQVLSIYVKNVKDQIDKKTSVLQDKHKIIQDLQTKAQEKSGKHDKIKSLIGKIKKNNEKINKLLHSSPSESSEEVSQFHKRIQIFQKNIEALQSKIKLNPEIQSKHLGQANEIIKKLESIRAQLKER